MNSLSQDRGRQALLCVLALGIGVISMGIARVLILGIHLFTNLFYLQSFSFDEGAPDPSHLGWLSILVPIAGGLIVGVMARFGSKAIRGHGIPEAMEKVLTGESRIHPNLVILKPLSSAIAIGSGGPFGAEGPIIATGGALGSWIGQWIPVTDFERKVLLASGAASGMTAIFNTPLAAVLLTVELLLFEYRARSIIPVALSTAVAAVMRNTLWTPEPFLKIAPLAAPTLGSLPIYLGAGVVFGLIALVATKSVYILEDAFEELPMHWALWPALGGLAVGLIGFWEPLTLGVGYSNIQLGLDGHVALSAALALAFWKLCSWAIALSSGTSGGTLAPLMTLGSLSGAALGMALRHLGLPADPSVLALVGMASVFSGCSRALLASVVFALEATREPQALVPLLCGCVVSSLVSHWFMENSIMTEKIARRGIAVPSEYVPHAG